MSRVKTMLKVEDAGEIRVNQDEWKDGFELAIQCECGQCCPTQFIHCPKDRFSKQYLESRCNCSRMLTARVVIYRPDVLSPNKESLYWLRTQEAKLPIKISCSKLDCNGESDVIFIPPEPGRSVVDGSCVRCGELLTATVDFIV